MRLGTTVEKAARAIQPWLVALLALAIVLFGVALPPAHGIHRIAGVRFVPEITTHYSDLKFAGHNSDAKLLGLFNVSILHNIVHLLFGVADLALARGNPPFFFSQAPHQKLAAITT